MGPYQKRWTILILGSVKASFLKDQKLENQFTSLPTNQLINQPISLPTSLLIGFLRSHDLSI